MWSRQRIVFSSDTRTKGGAPNPKLWLFGDRGTHQIIQKYPIKSGPIFPPPPKKTNKKCSVWWKMMGCPPDRIKILPKWVTFFEIKASLLRGILQELTAKCLGPGGVFGAKYLVLSVDFYLNLLESVMKISWVFSIQFTPLDPKTMKNE